MGNVIVIPLTLDNPIAMFLLKASKNMINKWVNIVISIFANDVTSIWLIIVFIT